MSDPKGFISLVLHAHLPFVRHPEHGDFLEEDWFFEAISETYIPLVHMMERLIHDGVDFRLTMSLTPSLCSMLQDGLLQDRYINHLNRTIELTEKELEKTKNEGQDYEDLAKFYNYRFKSCRDTFNRYGKNLLYAFRNFQDAGKLEIITCGATHGFLPLMQEHPECIRAQILTARDHYRECFGRNPRGIWLPECAYVPGIEKFLQEAEIRWFIVDTHGVLNANPRPVYGHFAPIFTPSGPAAFGRDYESSKQVWSSKEGYPGDVDYRDFYRDVGYDREQEYIAPYVQGNGLRKFTGLKYHRITGKNDWKEPYKPWVAHHRVTQHAANFMHNRVKQVSYWRDRLNVPPIIVSPYDAELFGHWWYEGPEFIEDFFRKSAYDQDTYQMITPGEYLQRFPTQQLSTPSASSWGDKGYMEVWLNGTNGWIYQHLHVANRRMIDTARKFKECDEVVDRVLKQMARELLLAQSSDWAFIMKTGTMVPYAVKRTKDHLLRFNKLYDQLHNNNIDFDFLANCEWRDNIFPNVNWRYYL